MLRRQITPNYLSIYLTVYTEWQCDQSDQYDMEKYDKQMIDISMCSVYVIVIIF